MTQIREKIEMALKKFLTQLNVSSSTSNGRDRMAAFALQFAFICLVALCLMACDSAPEQAAVGLLVPTEEPRQTIIYTRVTATPRPTQTPSAVASAADSQESLQMMEARDSDDAALMTIGERHEPSTESEPTIPSIPSEPIQLKVLQRQPMGAYNAPAEPTFRLRFSVEVPASAVRQALRIHPEVPVEIDVDGQAAMISVTEPLQVGETYYFALDQSKLEEAGFKLRKTYEWRVSRPKPLKQVTYRRAADAPFEFKFNYEMDREQFGNALQITPALDGELIWREGGHSVVFMPQSPLPPETEFMLSYTDKLKAVDGTVLGFPPAKEIKTGAAILKTAPAHDSYSNPAVPIEITFDRPMDPETTSAAFQIEPSVEGEVTLVEADRLIFQPLFYLDQNQPYTVTLGTEARSATGETVLREPFRWNFHTYDLRLPVSFGNGEPIQQLDPAGERTIHFLGASEKEVTAQFELYRLEPSRFVDGYLESSARTDHNIYEPILDVSGLPLVSSWQVDIKPTDDWGTGFETAIPAAVEPGFYALNLSADRLYSQLLLVVSPNRLAVKVADGETNIWLTDGVGRPVPAAEITLYDVNGGEIETGQTDNDGLFKTDIPSVDSPTFILAWQGNNVSFSAVGSRWAASQSTHSTHANRTGEVDHISFTILDRPIYRPGDRLYFKSIVRAHANAVSTVPDLSDGARRVEIEILDVELNVLQQESLALNEFGAADGSFLLPSTLEPGIYHLLTTYNGHATSETFEVIGYTTPQFNIMVEPNAERYVLGDSIELNVVVRDLNGQPVPNAAVALDRYDLMTNYGYGVSPLGHKWQPGLNNDTLTAQTDANGKVQFTLLAPDKAAFDEGYRRTLKDPITGQDGLFWGLAFSVKDQNGRIDNQFEKIEIYRSAIGVQLDPQTHVQAPNSVLNVTGTVLNNDRQPVAQQVITVKLEQYKNSHETIFLQSESTRTDAAGRFSLPLNLGNDGYYKLTVSGIDENRQPFNDVMPLYVFNRTNAQLSHQTPKLEISGTQTAYRVGEIAQLVIESASSGPALLTVERAGVLREQIVELNGPITLVDLPIEAGDSPSVVVGIAAWLEQDTALIEQTSSQHPGSRRFKTAYTRFDRPGR